MLKRASLEISQKVAQLQWIPGVSGSAYGYETPAFMQVFGVLQGRLRLVDPQSYLEFNYLVKHAKAVITRHTGERIVALLEQLLV